MSRRIDHEKINRITRSRKQVREYDCLAAAPLPDSKLRASPKPNVPRKKKNKKKAKRNRAKSIIRIGTANQDRVQLGFTCGFCGARFEKQKAFRAHKDAKHGGQRITTADLTRINTAEKMTPISKSPI